MPTSRPWTFEQEFDIPSCPTSVRSTSHATSRHGRGRLTTIQAPSLGFVSTSAPAPQPPMCARADRATDHRASRTTYRISAVLTVTTYLMRALLTVPTAYVLSALDRPTSRAIDGHSTLTTRVMTGHTMPTIRTKSVLVEPSIPTTEARSVPSAPTTRVPQLRGSPHRDALTTPAF